MAHPVIWTVGLAAVALVAAGVWLNQPVPEPPPETRASPVPAVEARPAPEPVPAAVPDPEPEPPLAGTPDPPVLLRPPDGGGLLIVPPRGAGPAPDPAPTGTGGLTPKPADPPPPAPEPATEPAPEQPDPDPSPDDESAAARPVAPVVLDPGHFRVYGPASRLEPLNMGLLSRERREFVVQRLLLEPPEPHFGAVAADALGQTVVLRAGMADLDAAETAALTDCRVEAAFCALVARIVPEDWDNRRQDTLSPAQALVWARALEAAGTGRRMLFGWSPGGAAEFALARDGDEDATIQAVARACAAQVPGPGREPGPCTLGWIETPSPEPEP